MPLYAYQAINGQGKRLKGSIDADSLLEAKEKLRLQGLMVAKLIMAGAVKGKENLRGETLIAFTLQLKQLIGAGIPVYESLLALEEQYRKESLHRVVLSLSEEIKSGRSLSEALACFPNSFDNRYRAMVAAGESVGALETVLERLTVLLQRQNHIKKKVTTAMIYPAVLGGFCLLILSLLLGFVVPSIEGIFEGRKLNGLTSFVIGLSHFVTSKWWAIVPCVAALIAYIVFLFRSAKGRLFMQRNGLKIPVVKTLMIQTALSRFTRTMGTLIQGGVPVVESLKIARGVMNNVVLEEVIEESDRKIAEGSSLSRELKRSPLIPALVSRMIAVGEETGKLGEMLHKIADMYEDELEKSLDRAMALMQPVILIVMGIIIGVILMAVLLPMTDIQAFTG